jgi:carbon storage regulator CsrA
MLVLHRKVRERVVIRDLVSGSETWVTVSEMRDGRVGLGFVAPASVKVYREEIAPPTRASAEGGAP